MLLRRVVYKSEGKGLAPFMTAAHSCARKIWSPLPHVPSLSRKRFESHLCSDVIKFTTLTDSETVIPIR
ncbi:hypothetical protein Bpfe_012836 [Biomphalaria pfeifferi]|uniref:Uncharacterized protein n=1 Tax=Biomphalaria pfeifferi TaxID=112525 RepID=A0AAD8FBR3_BIOPF|nr:hypothetical protein Bpfe_012836 [Biomphalaria pfeifferi]